MRNTLLLKSSKFSVPHPKSQCFPLLRPYPLRLASLPLPTTPFFTNPNPKSHKPFKLTLKSENSHLAIKEKTLNPIEFVLDSVSSALRALKKPAIAAVLVGLLLMYGPNLSLAASGGRMGGQAFSSGSGSSSSYSYYDSEDELDWLFEDELGDSMFFLIVMGYATFFVVYLYADLTAGKTSVIKFQVGLSGMARSLQWDLNRIAKTADTSTPEGLTYLLQETTLALLQHSDYCISAYSSVDVKRDMEKGEKKFNQLSIEERGKFDEETLVNVNNIKRQSPKGKRSTGFSNDYIVITILVAAKGVHKLHAITGSLVLKEAIQKLASIPSDKIMAVEVLWTPQDENDTLSERELLEDYPLMRPL